jgi:hypothetical protein
MQAMLCDIEMEEAKTQTQRTQRFFLSFTDNLQVNPDVALEFT